MSQTVNNQTIKPWIFWPFVVLVFAVLLTPFMVFKPLLFPFITSKAFTFRILVELALPFYVYLFWSYRNLRPSFKNPLTLVFLIFFAISLLTGFLGVNSIRSFWGNFERMGGNFYLAHLLALYFYLLLLAKLSEKYLQRFLQGFIAAAVLLTINGFSGWLGGPTITLDPSLPGRVSSTFGNPIFFASFLVIPLGLCLFFALSAKTTRDKILYGVGFLFLLWGVYISGTRGAAVGVILAGLISFFLYGLLSRRRLSRNLSLVGGTVFLALIILAFAFASHLPESAGLRRLFTLRDSNTQARFIQWKMAWQGFKERPLLGVGSESYYFIANKYHNPEINQYDQSWFDKPHNYYLEILVTTGIFGLLNYLAVLVLIVWGLALACKSELIAAGEFVVLLGGFLAYSFQNLFVFDTVSASLAFFIFCAFAGYFFENSSPDASSKSGEKQSLPRASAWAVLAIAGGCVVYLLYVANWLPMKASRGANYGYVYSSASAKKAAAFFEQAIDVPFSLDQPAVANRYSEFVDTLVSAPLSNVDSSFILAQIRKATDFQRQATTKIGNDPILWTRLSEDEVFLALAQSRAIGSEADDAAKKALELAPNRIEPWQMLLRLAGYRKDWPTAVTVAQKIIELNSYKPRLRIDLALALNQAGRDQEAVVAIDEALAQGYKFQWPSEFLWMTDYYKKQGDFAKVASLFEQAIKLEPTNLNYYLGAAEAYIDLGDKAKARLLLGEILRLNPETKAQLQPFLDKVK